MTRDAPQRIAEEAAEWFVANRDGLDLVQRATFSAWLRTSPRHVEEYLGVSLIAHDLPRAVADPDLNLEDLLARARGAAEESNVHSLGGRAPLADERSSVNSWRIATAAAVALIAVAFALLRWSDQQAPS